MGEGGSVPGLLELCLLCVSLYLRIGSCVLLSTCISYFSCRSDQITDIKRNLSEGGLIVAHILKVCDLLLDGDSMVAGSCKVAGVCS